MTENVCVYILQGSPPSMNAYRSKDAVHREYQSFLMSAFKYENKPIFCRSSKLWGRIFYFNYSEKLEAAVDVQNIAKPIFTLFIDYLYHTDKQLVFFTGWRLDMKLTKKHFSLKTLDNCPNQVLNCIINNKKQDNFCLVEIGMLPNIRSTTLEIEWIF